MNLDVLLSEVKALRAPGIKWNPERKDYDDIEVAPEAFVRPGESHIVVSGDAGPTWCDYYGEFRGGFPWIHPQLEALAERHGLYWQWENPGGIALYP